MPYLKCHICTLEYSKYVFFGDNLAVNSIIAKILKKLCKPKLDKNLGYGYVNHNQNSEKWKRNDSHEYIVIVYDLSFNITNVSIT